MLGPIVTVVVGAAVVAGVLKLDDKIQKEIIKKSNEEDNMKRKIDCDGKGSGMS